MDYDKVAQEMQAIKDSVSPESGAILSMLASSYIAAVEVINPDDCLPHFKEAHAAFCKIVVTTDGYVQLFTDDEKGGEQ